jgi:hypothetical protein
MGIENSTIQRKTAFFHALGKVLTESGNLIGNEKYKSAHSVTTSEIWAESVTFANTIEDAVIVANTIDSPVTQIGSTSSPAVLYPLLDSNFQTWFFDTGSPSVGAAGCIPSSGWVKPLINISDVPNSSGAPSNGYNLILYTNTDIEISYNNAFYDIDYYAGLIKFQDGATPIDTTGNNQLGFQMSQLDWISAAPAGVPTTADWASAYAFLLTDGPHAVAFQYTGQFLSDYLLNLPTSGGSGGSGSEEWQSSVNGYLIPIGNSSTVNSLTDINEQISYLNEEYIKYYVYVDDDNSGVTWSGISATNSYYEFNGFTFSPYTLSDSDDENRFLLLEGSLLLDTIQISSTGSVSEFPSTTVTKDQIIEYIGTASTGLTYSAWQVTPSRLGMVTTLDNKESSLARYVGDGSGWVEYQYETTYKVNSQKDIIPITTTNDYDIALSQTLQFEPSGDKSVDVYVNGVEVIRTNYIWGHSSASQSLVIESQSTNEIIVENSSAPTVNQYLQLDNGTMNYRQVIGVTASGSTQSLITYSGISVPTITNAWKFTITERSNNIARQGDWLLWIGSNWYELQSTTPADLVSLNYVTNDSSALNA